MNDPKHPGHADCVPAEARQVRPDTYEALKMLTAAHRDDDLAWLAPGLVEYSSQHIAAVRARETCSSGSDFIQVLR